MKRTLPCLVLSNVSLLLYCSIDVAKPMGILKPFSAKYCAGSNRVFKGNLANLLAASMTPETKPGIRTDAPLYPDVWTLGIWVGSP